MIVGFREFDGLFSRLEAKVGAVLVSPDGVQYECVKRSNYGTQWKIIGDQGEDGYVSIARMRELVGDGDGWLVAEVIPDTVYIVVDADNGGLDVGRGQGASRVRAFFSRERAEKAIKNMGAWNDTSSYRVVEYKMSKLNERKENREHQEGCCPYRGACCCWPVERVYARRGRVE